MLQDRFQMASCWFRSLFAASIECSLCLTVSGLQVTLSCHFVTVSLAQVVVRPVSFCLLSEVIWQLQLAHLEVDSIYNSPCYLRVSGLGKRPLKMNPHKGRAKFHMWDGESLIGTLS